MEAFFKYLVEANTYLIILYGIYWVVLRKESSLVFNRAYLVFVMLASIVFPFIDFSFNGGEMSVATVILLDPFQYNMNPETGALAATSWQDYLFWAYLLITFVFTTRLFRQFFIVLKNRNSISTSIYEGKKVFEINSPRSYSFFNQIYLDRELKGQDRLCILKHEAVHANQLHSVDRLTAELFIVLFWFNPVAWFLYKSLNEVHEYLADQGVVSSGISFSGYKRLLFEKSTGLRMELFVNSFSNVSLKRRFIMLSNSRKTKYWKYISVVLALILVATVNIFDSKSSNYPVRSYLSESTDTIKSFETVDVKPVYPGGDSELMEFLASNIKYPENARKSGAEGKVYVGFIIEKDGSVSNVKIKRSSENEELDSEGVRVVSSMPKWSPGEMDGKKVRVEYLIPINFKLNDGPKQN